MIPGIKNVRTPAATPTTPASSVAHHRSQIAVVLDAEDDARDPVNERVRAEQQHKRPQRHAGPDERDHAEENGDDASQEERPPISGDDRLE